MTAAVRSPYASTVTLPPAALPYPSLPEFLSARFPAISREIWELRMADGKVLDEAAHPLPPEAPYLPGSRIFYFREVAEEPVIPFAETILFQDEEILAACKPHFLPVTPGGRYVNECLLYRLRRRTGNHDLAPLHRLDRETAGIVLFSVNPRTRGLYGELFRRGGMKKTYEALSGSIPPHGASRWEMVDRIVKGEPWFRMKSVSGPANARTVVVLAEVRGDVARFELYPATGKTHQLRLHLSGLGCPILNDRLYPELQPETPDDFEKPLQLVARRISFQDPVTGARREFVSERKLIRQLISFPSPGTAA